MLIQVLLYFLLISGDIGLQVNTAAQSPAATMLLMIISQAKKKLSLIPQFVLIGRGGTRASLYWMLLKLFNPDLSWDRKNNPELWDKMSPTDQYKFYPVNVDYSKLKKEGPDF